MKTILAKATITGFENMRYIFEKDIILNGKSQKTYKSYILQIACISLYLQFMDYDIYFVYMSLKIN